MKQLALDLSTAPAPSLENFEAQGNEAVWLHLQQALVAPSLPALPLLLWGESGAGKSHVLQSVVAAARARGEAVLVGSADRVDTPAFDPTWRLIAWDDVDQWDDTQQAWAFHCLASTQGQTLRPWVVATATLPPADWTLRADVRTRLAQGLVFELKALAEDARLQVLRRAAQARGLTLTDEVLSFMVRRFSRDLGSLMALLAHLDAYALRTQRALTVPLLKSMLENE